jgi:hypothetical protein
MTTVRLPGGIWHDSDVAACVSLSAPAIAGWWRAQGVALPPALVEYLSAVAQLAGERVPIAEVGRKPLPRFAPECAAPPSSWLSTAEAGARLRVKERAVVDLLHRGRITGSRGSEHGAWRVDRESVERLAVDRETRRRKEPPPHAQEVRSA